MRKARKIKGTQKLKIKKRIKMMATVVNEVAAFSEVVCWPHQS
jgi:hypothetical protein